MKVAADGLALISGHGETAQNQIAEMQRWTGRNDYVRSPGAKAGYLFSELSVMRNIKDVHE